MPFMFAKRLKLFQFFQLSISSSDSDSESEPEYVATKSRLHQRKRKKKVTGQRAEAKEAVGEVVTVTDLLSNQVSLLRTKLLCERRLRLRCDSFSHILNPQIHS